MKTGIRFFYIFLLQLVLLVQAFAQVPTREPDRSAYLDLIQDLFHEVQTMDAVRESRLEREKFIVDFKKALVNTTAPNPTAVSGKTWSGMWPPRPVESMEWGRSPSVYNYTVIKPKAPDLATHSLKDLRVYVEQRLGVSAVRSLEKGQVVGVVYGGEETSALKYLGVSAKSAIRIPSFYESWGIKKIFVPSTEFADSRPRLIFIVPPSLQYLQHYAAMMKAIGATMDRVILDGMDQETYRIHLVQALEQIKSSLKATPDYAVMGYYNQWLPVVSAPDSEWLLLSVSDEAQGAMGLSGRILHLRNKKTGNAVRLLLINSGLTMWGQLAAFIAEAALTLRPRGLIFMGSSGSLSNLTEIYGLSVPEMFLSKGGRHHVPNFVQWAATRDDAQKTGSANVSFGARHGNTFSPIEQDKDYLNKLRQIGVDTIDVEQSLIADAVERFNKFNESNVMFGAVNLITDKPAHILDNSEADHDLDRVDYEKKDRARRSAVRLALRGLEEAEKNLSCLSVFASGK